MTTRRTRPMQRDLPSKNSRPSPLRQRVHPSNRKRGAVNAASLPQPTPCASAFFFFGVLRSCRRFYGRAALDNLAVLRAIQMTFTQALTCFYILSNIRPFPGGSPVMPRTSRCFAGTFLQLGGPDTLLSVEHFPLNLSFADFSFAHFLTFSVAKFFSGNFAATSKCGSPAHDQRGNARRG